MTGPGRRIRAVLFDLGGTLVDEADYEAWAALARRVYLDLDADTIAHFVGEVQREVDATPTGLPQPEAVVEFWRRVLARAAGREVDRATAARYWGMLHEAEGPVRLFSDVRRCLDQLKGEHRALGVVSNSTSEAAVRRILDRTRILEYFDRVVSSGTEGVAKPDPEIFRRATSRLGLKPQEAVYVGNLPVTDARGAAAAGLHGVWLNREGMELGDDPPEIMSLLEVPLVVARLERGDGP